MNMLRNWKTTLAGIAAIIAAASLAVNHPDKYGEAVTMALAGFGLILAKDGDKSGTA
jgi:hypothetical protein